MFELYRSQYIKLIYNNTKECYTKNISLDDQFKISKDIGNLYSKYLKKQYVIPSSECMYFPVLMKPFEFLTISSNTGIHIPTIINNGKELIPKCVKRIFFVMICMKDNLISKSLDCVTLILGHIQTSSEKWTDALIQNNTNGVKKILRISDLEKPDMIIIEDHDTSPVIEEETYDKSIIMEDKDSTDNDKEEIQDHHDEQTPCLVKNQECLKPSSIQTEDNNINEYQECFDLYSDISNDSANAGYYESSQKTMIPYHKMVHLYIFQPTYELNPNVTFSMNMYHSKWLPTLQNMIKEFKSEEHLDIMSEKTLKSVFFAMGCFNKDSMDIQKAFIHMIVRILVYHEPNRLQDMIVWMYTSIVKTWVDSMHRLKYLNDEDDNNTTIPFISSNIIEKEDSNEISFYSESDDDSSSDESEYTMNKDKFLLNSLSTVTTTNINNIEQLQQKIIDNITLKMKNLCDRMSQLDHWNTKRNYFYNQFMKIFQYWQK